MVKFFSAAVIGVVLGIVGSRIILVGSAWSLLVWGVIGLALGWWAVRMSRALLNGAAYGFSLAFAFMLAGYSGTAPILMRVFPFALIGLVGAVCGLALALGGTLARRVMVRRRTG